MDNKKDNKPKKLVEAIPSYGWKEREDYKKESRGWLSKSRRVALRILDRLEEKGMSQQALADLLIVKRQRVNAIVKGQENFTFETISKLEHVLEIPLMDIYDGKSEKAQATASKATIVNVEEISFVEELSEIINKYDPHAVGKRSMCKIYHQVYYTIDSEESWAGENDYAKAS